MSKKKVITIKVLLYLLLASFIIFILYMMYLEPYASNSHLFTQEECDNSYDCKCIRDTENQAFCSCKYKKWFIESRGDCIKNIDDPNIVIVDKW